MLKRLLVVSLLLVPPSLSHTLHAQAVPTATRLITGQIGAGVSVAHPDYTNTYIQGISIYGSLDLGRHIGIDGEIHEVTIRTPADIGEASYLLGGRYHITRGRFQPYAKALAGIGVFSEDQGYFPVSSSRKYFMYALGAGLDYNASRRINIRVVDFEYQDWTTFSPNDLKPYVITVGAAYRF